VKGLIRTEQGPPPLSGGGNIALAEGIIPPSITLTNKAITSILFLTKRLLASDWVSYYRTAVGASLRLLSLPTDTSFFLLRST
jgi:hypothetical protein